MSRHLANLLTVAGILAGLSSVILSLFTEQFLAAGVLILVSAVIDRYDGKLARHLGIETRPGRWLDSANDFLSFGIAPIILLGRFIPFANTSTFFILAAIFLFSNLFRLVRFNTRRTADMFTGLPTTVAGVVLTITAFIAETAFTGERPGDPLVFPLMAMLSVLMIATFRWKKI